jgi:hypothetical protein
MLERWRWVQRNKLRRSPLTRDLLRSPGESLRAKIVDADDKVTLYLFCVMVMPLVVYAGHVTDSYFFRSADSTFRVILSVSFGIGTVVVCSWKLVRSLDVRRRLVFGLEGELATGQELDQLMLDGCPVFHDVPTDWGNIDHVVISPTGVYSVETKMRGKPRRTAGDMTVEVDYDRQVLRFPDYEGPLPLKQLDTQRRWLSDFLTRALDEKVEVQSILAFPGWNIVRK